MAENTFDFVLAGEEKDNATHVQCSLFQGDYSDLIGARCLKATIASLVYQSFFVFNRRITVVVVITVVF